jgi:hypothetical protein
LHEKYGTQAAFRLIYIREAHAVDGDSPPRETGAPCVEDPVTLEERTALAQRFVHESELAAIPLCVDGMDDAAGIAYAAAPDRLYLIGAAGKVLWKSGKGPAGFDPAGLEAALRTALGL